MDRQSVYSTHVFEPSHGDTGDSRLQLQNQLETFILDFRLDNNFVYRWVICRVSGCEHLRAEKSTETS